VKQGEIKVGVEYAAVPHGTIYQYRAPTEHSVAHVRVVKKGVSFEKRSGYMQRTVKGGVEVEFVKQHGNAYKRGDRKVLEARRFYMTWPAYQDWRFRQEEDRQRHERVRAERDARIDGLNAKLKAAGFDLEISERSAWAKMVGELDEIEKLVEKLG
jgi:hypothetical protein